MRVGYVCVDPGIPVFGSKGASIHATAVIRELVAAGHQVHLITPRPGGPAPDRVEVHPLTPVPSGTVAERELAAMATDTEVAAVLEKIQPDLVYERYSLWGRTATEWARVHRVPSILEVNSPLPAEQAQHRGLVHAAEADVVARHALSTATAVACVSEPVRTWVRSQVGQRPRLAVIANGVDCERIPMATRPVTPDDANSFVVGFVGTLKPWHGVETLLAALHLLVETDPTWRGLVVGDGPLADELAALAPVGTTFTGALPPHEIGAALHRMDIAVAPYPAATPGANYFSPLKLYEYLAGGVPVLAGAVGQVPEVLRHGRLGELYPPGDVAALAAGLRRLRADVSRRAALRILGRQAAETEHTWRTVLSHTLDLVQQPLRRAG